MIGMVARVEPFIQLGDVQIQRGAGRKLAGDDGLQCGDEIAPSRISRAAIDGLRLGGRARAQTLQRKWVLLKVVAVDDVACLLYTSPSPRDS